jgi:predicted solute-binding protein
MVKADVDVLNRNNAFINIYVNDFNLDRVTDAEYFRLAFTYHCHLTFIKIPSRGKTIQAKPRGNSSDKSKDDKNGKGGRGRTKPDDLEINHTFINIYVNDFNLDRVTDAEYFRLAFTPSESIPHR